MNCPACQSPLLFGSTSCGCGYQGALSAAPLSIELTYWEALRAYWRVYWPLQILVFGLTLLLARALVFTLGPAQAAPLLRSLALQLIPNICLSAIGLFLLIPRLTSRPYRGFALRSVSLSDEAPCPLTFNRRAQIWFFLWWRYFVASLLVGFLAGPLNMVLSLFLIQVGPYVLILAGVLVVGPILLKMLIGYRFPDFRLEAQRQVPAP